MNAETAKAYHHGDLRQALIDAACKCLKREGADTLSLRALAREIGVSQTAPYRHFESKNALFAAIAIYGFELMKVDCEAARDKHKDDVEAALVEVGLAYVNWALANPEKYQLFFDSSLLDYNAYDDLHTAGNAAFSVVLDLVRRGQDEGVLLDGQPELLAGTLWAGVHGIASLLKKQATNDLEPRRDLPVPIALNALAADPRGVVEMVLNSIKKPC